MRYGRIDHFAAMWSLTHHATGGMGSGVGELEGSRAGCQRF
jgi:hypothetical protein